MKFNGVSITEESIDKARRWFADNARACAIEAESGDVRVNDLPAYLASCEGRERDALAGAYDHTFAFMQRAHYIQTGECIALLP